MSTDLEAKIEIIEKQVRENNKILKDLRSRSRWATIFGIIKIVVYVLLLVGAYTALKPILDQFLNTYSAIQQGADSLAEIKAGTQGIDFEAIKGYFSN